jgi:3'-5' exoribonuclease
VTGFYVIRKSELKTKKDGSPYLLLEIGDNTGRIAANIWNNADSHYASFKVGDIVKLLGTVQSFQDTLKITVDKIRSAKPEDGQIHRNFIKTGDFDISALWTQMTEYIESIQNIYLKKMLNTLFGDPWWKDRFKDAPGGKLWHHAYLGGLLEHTLSVVAICDAMAKLYPKINRDLLIAGALVHDIGKIDEYGFDKGFIDFTDEGRLWGHISIGAQQIRSLIEKLEEKDEFPNELKKQLLHLILSHQGELEHGSPVLPATLEAIILYYSDEMDSKANAFQHIIERDSAHGRKWSQYIQLINRFIYLGENSSSENQTELFIENSNPP